MRPRITAYASAAVGAASLLAVLLVPQASGNASVKVASARPAAAPAAAPARRRPRPSPTPTPPPTPTTPSPSPTPTNPSPYPAALGRGHPFVQEVDPPALAAAPWNDPTNNPGNCAPNPRQVSLNASGYAELDTTGAVNNCTSIQSPQMMPSTSGYVYEADVYFSTFDDWPAFWMYGNNWPAGGEIDSVEAEYGVSFVSWHSAACSHATSSSVISTDPWSYACKTTVQPTGTDITAGWHVVDIAFTSSGVQVYYDGSLYVTISESVTAGQTADPMWLTFSEGSCNSGGDNECASGTSGPAGNVQVKYLRVFS
ncbi:MAG TPA: glycoside hydrolase family 16 protein [Trebonia sp.]